MFARFLIALRGKGLGVGIGDWLVFLQALSKGLATTPDELYELGRALICRSEAEYDAYDQAFAEAFDGVVLPPDLAERVARWLADPRARPDAVGEARFGNLSELLAALAELAEQQDAEHHGGSRWLGAGGTSPWGQGGRNAFGVALGQDPQGGRTGVRAAVERKWRDYRGDRTLDVRDLAVVLRALRSLQRDGRPELDVDETIDLTCRNGGDLEIVERPERKNRLKVVLIMDAGGSMAPHANRVERLFSAAREVKTFRSLQSYTFHNCVYNSLYTHISQLKRLPTHEVLASLTPQHRVIFVGDGAMAPYELFGSYTWPGNGNTLSGEEWLRRFRERCPASVWLNPDPPKYWRHATVSAIGRIFPMYELTVDGVRDAVRKLRAPH